MSSPDSLQRHLHGVEELAGLTRAMKTLSAVAVRQYENAAESLEAYYATVEMGLSALLTDRLRHLALIEAEAAPPAGPTGVVVIGSDTGLCGRFNEEAAAHALGLLGKAGAGARVLAVGERVCPLLTEAGLAAEACLRAPGSVAGVAPLTQELLIHMQQWREQGLRRLVLVHNRQRRGEAYRPGSLELLPLNLRHFLHLERRRWPSRARPMHTLDDTRLFAALVREYLFSSVFRACAHSLASENASRLQAMQAAERNIGERRDELMAAYRQARQGAITEELLDVVAGYEVLAGEP